MEEGRRIASPPAARLQAIIERIRSRGDGHAPVTNIDPARGIEH
jgi:hypothetical protein